MNPEIKAEWMKRLRSNQYQQGLGYLRSDGRYCCLGVLCEMAVEAGVVEFTDGEGCLRWYGNSRRASVLPSEVMEWAGLVSASGVFAKRSGSLSQENDNGATFKALADMIEEEF